MEPDGSSGARPHGVFHRVRATLAPRARLWGFMVPLHILAFVLLYVLSVRVMVTEVVSATSGLALRQLEFKSREIMRVARNHPGTSADGHLFEDIVLADEDIDFRLLLPGGGTIGGASPPPVEHREMVDFLASDAAERIWLAEEGEVRRMRGLRRMVADASCQPCHPPGELLAVSSMSLDLTRLLDRVVDRGRRNMLLLLLFWATLLTLTTVIVRRSVRSSTARIEAELAAVGSGRSTAERAPDLVLDPVSARLQIALRSFLERQRERQAEVASRLAHTDQLASLGQLAAGLAHEIKNPLAGIQGALEILREDEASDSTRTLYDDMLAELKRVDSTLRSLLASARPAPPQRTESDARALVEEVRRLLEPALRRRGVEFETEFAAGRLIASFDPAKIRQVLVNLIQNAADAIEDGGRVKVSVMRCPNGTGAIFVVEDDGCGIPPAQQERLFEPFYTTKFSGTGLGLAIARSLVEQHDGTLEFESTPGEGTTFYVILPENLGADESGAKED